jgi:hypothetical protein
MFGIKTKIEWLYGRYVYYPLWTQKKFDKNVKELQKKERITIAFVTMNVAMWKYQALYDLLKKNPRFRLYVIISPSVKFDREVMISDAMKMRDYFKSRSMEFIDWDLENNKNPVDIKKAIDPDILFYTQPWKTVFTPIHSFQNFTDKLICYCPYGFYLHNTRKMYDRPFDKAAWKLYYYTDVQKSLAVKYSRSKGRNVVVTGHPDYERYINDPFEDVWKIKDKSVKRVIWAPHFTITHSQVCGFQKRSTFLEISGIMLDIAKRYQGRIQIAFKPHPRLLSELYTHPDWGKAKADEYYKEWAELPNGQLETGEYISLFHFSDALIHDSSSFTLDYLYFEKPEMFLTDDIQSYIDESDELGQLVYKSIYHGKKETEIISFIENVVLNGNDMTFPKRQQIVKEYMLPPHGRTAAENMYIDICKSIGIK